jgi:phage baseplate assembly protein gpV
MSPRLKDLERQVRDLHGMVRRLVGWRATLEDRMDKQVRHGKVTDVDTKKQLARLEIGNKDGTSLKSPWVPYAQVAGPDGQGSGNGEFKFHNPPAVGQQMSLFSPNGEFRQSLILPFTWYDKAVSPSQKNDEHVITYGKLKKTYKKTEYTVGMGDAVSLDLTTDTATIKATTIILQGNVLLGDKGATRPLALKDSVDSSGDTEASNLATKVKAV